MAVESAYLDVRAPDGVGLCVRTCGAPGAPAILFLHGFSQSHLSWIRQLDRALTDEFLLVAVDLRGHGWSSKPTDRAAYQEACRWADDIAAVLRAVGISRVVLVGWSFGGRVVLDYLAACGGDTIAGINFVASVIDDDKAYYGADIGLIRATLAQDPAASIEGSRAFLRACFEREPNRGQFEFMLAYNAMTPPAIRAMLLGRPVDIEVLAQSVDIPVLFTHGTADRIVAPAMSHYGASKAPHATVSLYEGIGHSPFSEAHERYNRELLAFARTCYGVAT